MSLPPGHFPSGPDVPASPWERTPIGPAREFDSDERFDRSVDAIEHPGADGGIGSDLHPFKISDEGSGDISVSYGQVNSTPPSNYNTPIAAVTGFVYLHVTVDVDGAITAVSIAVAAAVPANTSTDAYLAIGSVTVDSGSGLVTAINQGITHSLGYARCGVSTHDFWGI